MKNKKPRFVYYVNTYRTNINKYRKALTELSDISLDTNNYIEKRIAAEIEYFNMIYLLDTVKRIKRG